MLGAAIGVLRTRCEGQYVNQAAVICRFGVAGLNKKSQSIAGADEVYCFQDNLDIESPLIAMKKIDYSHQCTRFLIYGPFCRFHTC